MKRYNSKQLTNKEYRRLKYMKKIKLKKLNKKGNFMMTAIIALAFFMFGILIIGLLFTDIAIARSSSNLDCSNMTISSGNKLACLGVDGIVPAFAQIKVPVTPGIEKAFSTDVAFIDSLKVT